MSVIILLIITAGIGFFLIKKIFSVLNQKSLLKDGMHFEYEVAIVGSGILGSALATVLARDGRKVVVIERDMKMPERVVGELLQPGGCRALNILDLSDCLENIDAQDVFGYVIHDHDVDKIDVTFPSDEKEYSGGKAFQHGKFVMNLRNKAMAEKNVTYIEGTVLKLLENGNVVTGAIYKAKDNNEQLIINAKLTIVADGCFSKLRKSLVHDIPQQKSTFVGLFLKDCPQSRPHYAEIALTNTCPILAYQISGHDTRLFVDVRGEKIPRNIREYLADIIYPEIPGHLQGPFLEAVNYGPIKSMPNGFLPPCPIYKSGAMVLGDALNMRHPITGGGMSVAFHDIIIFRELLSNIKDLTDYKALTKASKILHRRRKNSYSFVVNVLSMALYELFAANDKWLKRIQKACFQYLKKGGSCSSGPIALLGILQPSPLIFFRHFISVAGYAIYLTFKSHPVTKIYRSLYESVCILVKACNILFPLIWSEAKTMIT